MEPIHLNVEAVNTHRLRPEVGIADGGRGLLFTGGVVEPGVRRRCILFELNAGQMIIPFAMISQPVSGNENELFLCWIVRRLYHLIRTRDDIECSRLHFAFTQVHINRYISVIMQIFLFDCINYDSKHRI